MNDPDRKFWPFRPRTSIAFAVLILVGLLIIFVVLKKTDIWAEIQESDITVLIGILLLSLLPILFSLLNVIIERGGVIKAGGVEIAFSQVPQMGASGLTVPVNIGVPGQPVTDSSTTEIFDALKQKTAE